jgi:hypothetical protein
VADLDFSSALAYLMGRLGDEVTVVIGTHAPEGPPLVMEGRGRLVVEGTNEIPTEDEVAGNATFSLEGQDVRFVIDRESFTSATAYKSVLRINLGQFTIEVADPEEELGEEPDETELHERQLSLPATTTGPARDVAPEPDSPTAFATAKPTRRSWLRRIYDRANQPLPATVLGGLILIGIGWLAGVFDGPDLRPAPNKSTTIERTGELTGPRHVRILKQAGARNSYVVSGRIAHHIQTQDIYNCSVGHFPVHWNVDAGEFKSFISTDKYGENASCPAGVQPVLSPDLITDRYMLRERNERTWLVVDGQRVPILDGPTFNCLSERYLVWDFVSAPELESFPLHPSLRQARC